MDCYLNQLCVCGCSTRAYIYGTKIYTNFACVVGNLSMTRNCCYFLAELLKTALLLSVKSHDFAQYFITVRKRSCGKVMFLHLSVSHSVHGGCIPACTGQTPLADTPVGRHTHILGRPPCQPLQQMVRILLECILPKKII